MSDPRPFESSIDATTDHPQRSGPSRSDTVQDNEPAIMPTLAMPAGAPSSDGDSATGATRPNPGSAASSPLPAEIGRYKVCDQLGAGTFGTVYRCHDEQLHRDVAIKIPHAISKGSPTELAEFMHEARSAARLRHPGIVAVLDVGETTDGRGYIVYEFVPGQTLRDRMLAGDYPRDQAVQWVAEVAEALHYAHKQGLVHRDIKPANILIDEQGRSRLTDFGLAKVDDHYLADEVGRILGTVAYMSPEQARGFSHWASPQSDIYALGVVLYELLSKRLPFKGSSSMDMLEQVRERDPAPPRTIDDTIPKPLEDICLKAMAKSAADRYTTAADIAADLRRTLAPPKPPRRSAVPLVAAAVGGMLVLGLAAFVLRDRIDERQPGLAIVAASAVPDGTAELPKLKIVVQRAEERKGGWEELGPGAEPLRQGDKVQLEVALLQPRYAYLYWYDTEGTPQRLWPDPNVPLSDQRPVTEVIVPHGANAKSAMWWEIDNRRGTELVLVGASDHALTANDLHELESEPLVWSGQLSRVAAALSISPLEEPGGTTRGLGRKVVSAKAGLSDEFKKRLSEKFKDHYNGWAIRHD